jgi:phage FluMu protein Com
VNDADDFAVPDSEGQDIAAQPHDPVSYVDGNAAAGVLSEVFRIDIIAALGRCRHCGSIRAFGEAMVYIDAPGIVVRCRDCQGVLLRLVETPTRYWLDLSGLNYLEIYREE